MKKNKLTKAYAFFIAWLLIYPLLWCVIFFMWPLNKSQFIDEAYSVANEINPDYILGDAEYIPDKGFLLFYSTSDINDMVLVYSSKIPLVDRFKHPAADSIQDGENKGNQYSTVRANGTELEVTKQPIVSRYSASLIAMSIIWLVMITVRFLKIQQLKKSNPSPG